MQLDYSFAKDRTRKGKAKLFEIVLSLIFGLIPLSARAQGVSVQGQAVVNTTTSVSGIPGNSVLQAVPNAQITVCSSVGGGIPCTPLVTIYSNVALTIVAANPLTADANGNFSFFVPPNATGYVYSQTGSGIVGQLFTIAPQTTTVSGTMTVSNINADLYVCPNAGCLYQTILAAYNALPNCTITPTPVNAGGTAGSSVTVPCGTIHVAPGTYPTPASTVIINSSFVRVLGSGQFNTILNCSTACYEITGDSSWGGTVTAYPGGFYDLDIEGGGSTLTGLLLIGATGLQLHRVRIAGFSGIGGQGLMVQNDLTAYSERMNWSDVILDNNKVGLRLDAPNSGLVNLSMGHNNWFGLKIQMNNGQTGMKLTGGIQLYESSIQGVFNSYPPNTNAYTALDMSGTNANAVLQGYFFMPVDNGGGGTMTVCTGCTGGVSGNFHNSWGSFFVNNSLFTTEDGGPVMNATATGAPADGLTWALNHVNKYQLYLDGGAGLSLFNGSMNAYTFDPQLFCIAGSASGSVCLLPSAAAAAGNLNLPNQTDTLIGRTTSDTLTNKTLTSPTITNPVINTTSITGTPASANLTATIANGTKALNTASITTATCDAGVVATATGTLSTDTVDWSFNAPPTATNKYGAFLVVYAVPSANTVTFYTCNPSATTSTPTAMTVNFSVRRP